MNLKTIKDFKKNIRDFLRLDYEIDIYMNRYITNLFSIQKQFLRFEV